MFGQDLRKPLKRQNLLTRLWQKRPGLMQLVAATLVLAFAGFAIWVYRTPYPFAGEPVIVMAIPPAQEMTTGSTSKPAEPAETGLAAEEEPLPDTGEEPDQQVESSGEKTIVETDTAIIIEPRRTLPPAPIAAVSEEGPYGPLPKIGPNNKKPATVYARQASLQALSSNVPKIALVLGGMGLNQELTKQATQDLPGEITFAFAPYGDNLQAQVNKARAEGHEVMLQLPMEPFGYPAVNPGPKTILAAADANANLDSLTWHMSQFAGYTGIVNYMGAKVLAEPQVLKPVLAELRKRGLIFLGDGTAPRSVAGEVGNTLGLPVRSASVLIDGNPDSDAIIEKLEELERLARKNGIAVGSGTGLDVTIETVKLWSKSLAERGVVLIPVSAAYRGRQG
jgi:hypothetical protein